MEPQRVIIIDATPIISFGLGESLDLTLTLPYEKVFYTKIGVLKRISIRFHTPTDEAPSTAEQPQSDLSDAFYAYGKLSIRKNLLEFQKIVRGLSDGDRISLQDFVDEEFMERLSYPVSYVAAELGKKAKGGAGAKAGGFIAKAAAQAIGAAIGKATADEMARAYGDPASEQEPFDKAVAGLVLTVLIAGIFLQTNNPRLAKIMVKLGAVGLAFAVLHPMVTSLPPEMAWIFGALAALIVLLTAALA